MANIEVQAGAPSNLALRRLFSLFADGRMSEPFSTCPDPMFPRMYRQGLSGRPTNLVRIELSAADFQNQRGLSNPCLIMWQLKLDTLSTGAALSYELMGEVFGEVRPYSNSEPFRNCSATKLGRRDHCAVCGFTLCLWPNRSVPSLLQLSSTRPRSRAAQVEHMLLIFMRASFEWPPNESQVKPFAETA